MKESFLRLLKDYDYHSGREFILSLFPSAKYNLSAITAIATSAAAIVELIFGITWLAFLALLIILLVELISGIYTSQIRKEPFQSKRLKRFGFRVFCYLCLIGVPFIFADSYRSKGKTIIAGTFDWLHISLVLQIVFENIVSVLENVATIDGKDKTYLINKIKDKITSLL